MNMTLKKMKRGFAVLLALGLLISGLLPGVVLAASHEKDVISSQEDVVSLRTETSKTYNLGNSRFQTVVGLESIHYKDNYSNTEEPWKDIDLTWVGNSVTQAPYIIDRSKGTYTIRNKRTDEIVSIRPLGNANIILTNTNINFQWSTLLTNTASFEIMGDVDMVSFFAYDSEGSKVALDVTKSGDIYTEKASKGAILADPTVTVQIEANTDDAIQRESDGEMFLNISASTWRASANPTYRYWGGDRWVISIPQFSTINSANYTGYCNSDSNDSANFNMHFQMAASTVTFNATAFNLTDRDRTTASVSWVASDLGIGWHESSDLTIPMQELVSAYDVTSIVMIARPNTDFSTNMSWCSHDGDPALAAKLFIDYTVPILDPPGDFEVEQVGVDSVELTWTNDPLSDNVTIVIQVDGCPADRDDGYIVYIGSSENVTIDGLNLGTETYCFRIWSENTDGFSTTYAEAEIGGSNMVFLGILGFAAIISFLSFRNTFYGLKIMAGMSWVIVFIYLQGNPPIGIEEGSGLHTALLVVAFGFGLMVVLAGLRTGIKRTEQLNKGLSLTSEKFQWKLPDWMNATQGETQAQSRARQQEETDDYRDEFHRALHQPRRGRRL